jgi:multiple sugar transport system ATP-binding protein
VDGLEEPTSGEIYFDGVNVVDQPPQERNIAMLFQDIALWPHMTVRENMVFALSIRGHDAEDTKERVESVAKNLQIYDKLDESPVQLSGGQRQRVALGRAIVHNPQVFLFDEPLSALDAALKREILPLIKQIVKDLGVPAIYVTHDQQEAMKLSDKIAVMSDGRIEQAGTPLEVYESPRNRFVGEFIGNPRMNLMDTEIESRDGRTFVDIDGIEVDIDGSPGDSVTVGVRPQDVVVEDASTTDGISATHILDEPQGESTHSHFETDYGEQIAVTASDFRGRGQEYKLSFRGGGVHVFGQDGEVISIGE